MLSSKFLALVTSLGEGVNCFKSGANPCDLCDLLHVGQNFFYLLLEAGTLIAVGVIVYGAIRLMTAGGSKNLAEEARKIITNAIVGILIAIGGWVIINTIIFIITPDKGTNSNWFSIECQSTPIFAHEELPKAEEEETNPQASWLGPNQSYAKVAADGKYACGANCGEIQGTCPGASCFPLDKTSCGQTASNTIEVYGFKEKDNGISCFADERSCNSAKSNKDPEAIEWGCSKVKTDQYASVGGTSGCPNSFNKVLTELQDPNVSNFKKLPDSQRSQCWEDCASSVGADEEVIKNLRKLHSEFDKMKALLNYLGFTVQVNSVYREPHYQQYLADLWKSCEEINCLNNNNACENLTNLVNTHGLRSTVADPSRGQNAPHIQGKGIDVKIQCGRGTCWNQPQNAPCCFVATTVSNGKIVPDYHSMGTHYLKFQSPITLNVNGQNYTFDLRNLTRTPGKRPPEEPEGKDYADYFYINDLLQKAGIGLKWQNIPGDEVHFNYWYW